MKSYYTQPIEKSPRIGALIDTLYKNMPEIEADRAVLLTESYRETEGEPIITRRAKAFYHICKHIPITIRDGGADCRERDKGAARVPGVPGVLVRVARG